MEAYILDKYTINDVENREDHAELIGGNIVVTDYVSPKHNLVAGEIYYALKGYIKSNGGNCKVFGDSVALYCNNANEKLHDYYMPDVMVVCDENGYDDMGVHVAPALVVEVTSEGSKKYDYVDKLYAYKEMGVNEYLIIDIQKNVVLRYLKTDDYSPEIYIHPDKIQIAIFDSLEVDLSEYMK